MIESRGGEIYLVEDEQDVEALMVKHPEKVAFVLKQHFQLMIQLK
jgi:hypothetical protein